MTRILVTVNLGSVLPGVRLRKERAYAAANAAAETITAYVNDELIPAHYPGRVAQALRAYTEAYRFSGRMAAVRVRRLNRLWNFYEFGVKPHREPKAGITLMKFYWEKMGRPARFWVVDHPGYEGRHQLPTMRDELRTYAREAWRVALAEALGAV